jgi:hypothetical protein
MTLPSSQISQNPPSHLDAHTHALHQAPKHDMHAYPVSLLHHSRPTHLMSLIFCASCRSPPPIITIASWCSRSRSPRCVLGRRRSRPCPPIFIGTDRSRICSPSCRLVTAVSVRFHQLSFLASVIQSPIHLGGSSGARYTLCSREERDGG